MDSPNLTETQSKALNFRSTASNTSPFPCEGCNLKEFQQDFCFPSSNPGKPKCKHFQNGQENFSAEQQFFPSLPLLPNFVCNTASINSCCHHKPAPDGVINGPDKAPSPSHHFCQRERCSRANNISVEEDAQKNSHLLGPEWPFWGHPFHFANAHNSQFNSFYQRCGCGDSLPWSCNSFIVPVISYCVFWNSRKANSLTGGPTETMCQQSREPVTQPDRVTKTPSKIPVKDFNNNITETESCQNCLRVDSSNDWKDGQEKEGDDNQAFRSVNILCSSFAQNDSLRNGEQSDKSVEYEDEEEEEEEEEDDSIEEEEEEEDEDEDDEEEDEEENEEDQRNNYVSFIADDRQAAGLIFSNETIDHASDKSQPTSREELKMVEKKSSTKSAAAEFLPSAVNSTEDKYSGVECKQTNPSQKEISFKKFINNFTMTDQTNNIHEGTQISTAAAGDLGGINCSGYKINISSFEEVIPEKSPGAARPQEIFQPKKIHSKDSKGSEESKQDRYSKSNSEFKAGRNLKSGIAKATNISKLKETKGDAVKIIKSTKEPSPRVPPAIKMKDNSLPADTVLGVVGSSSKLQKTKNNKVVPQAQGIENRQKAANSRGETLRKGDVKPSRLQFVKNQVKK